MKDSFYTPTFLANLLVNYIDEKNVLSVADFCVGNGELLRAASVKWPRVRCFGTDISKKAISITKKMHPDWDLFKCDFLSESSRKKVLQSCKIGFFDLILMNPPFSCVGGTINEVYINDKLYKVSTAMAFLLYSLKFLSENGSLYAIMPNSVAYSEKDKQAWDMLIENYNLNILNESNKKYFEGCSPNVILISLKNNRGLTIQSKIGKLKSLNSSLEKYSVFRGKVGMHSLNGNVIDGYHLVHSTNLRNNNLENLNYRIKNKLSQLTGPAVLIPRVGLPNKGKICILKQNETVVLSDCILAIKTDSDKNSLNLQATLINNWSRFENLYKGTGAKYTTIKKIEQFLEVDLIIV